MSIEVLVILLSWICVGSASAIGFILVALFLVVGLNKIFKGGD